jgi:hypothetical protein
METKSESVAIKNGFAVISARFYSGYSHPIASAVSKKDAEAWLRETGWEKSTGANKGLWEKEDTDGKWSWAQIVACPMVIKGKKGI